VAVDAASLEVVFRQWGGNQPTGLAVSPDGRRLVFTDFLDRRVEAYDIGRPLAPVPGSRKGVLE
jgi:sugar lactone lactonase YvrE